MPKITVWECDMAGYPANIPRFRLRLTREAIEQNGFTLRDGTDLQVDAQMVNANGYTRLEYLTFRVRILHSQAFAGYPSVPERERQRVVVEAGEYDARLTLREYVPVVGPENCLQLVDADKRGGDLFIKVSEYDELETFPVEVNPLHIEILSVRVTSPDEI